MIIKIKNKDTLIYDEFIFQCCVGKNGFSKNKVEGDKKTPIGNFSLGNLYYRNDRKIKPISKLKIFKIKKNMGWCDDPKSEKYNKLIESINRFKVTEYDFSSKKIPDSFILKINK